MNTFKRDFYSHSHEGKIKKNKLFILDGMLKKLSTPFV